jgi:hypothetical protein
MIITIEMPADSFDDEARSGGARHMMLIDEGYDAEEEAPPLTRSTGRCSLDTTPTTLAGRHAATAAVLLVALALLLLTGFVHTATTTTTTTATATTTTPSEVALWLSILLSPVSLITLSVLPSADDDDDAAASWDWCPIYALLAAHILSAYLAFGVASLLYPTSSTATTTTTTTAAAAAGSAKKDDSYYNYNDANRRFLQLRACNNNNNHNDDKHPNDAQHNNSNINNGHHHHQQHRRPITTTTVDYDLDFDEEDGPLDGLASIWLGFATPLARLLLHALFFAPSSS